MFNDNLKFKGLIYLLLPVPSMIKDPGEFSK